jgi:hypothetical protein
MRAPLALFLASLPVLLLSSAVSAQNAPTPAQYSLPLHSSVCPVDLDVRHESGLHAVVPAGFKDVPATPPELDSIVRSAPPQQSLTFDIRNPGSREIVSVDLLIRTEGSSKHAAPMLLQAGDTFGTEPAEQFTLHLDRSIDAQNVSRFSHSIPSLNAIAFIELQQVTYKDGTSWIASSQASCRYKLNPLMLVDSGASIP